MGKKRGHCKNKGAISNISNVMFPFIFKARQAEFEKNTMAAFVAERSTFDPKQIQAIHDKTHSWDLALASCGYALINGNSDLLLAFMDMKKQHPQVDNLELYRLYGIL